MTTILVRYGEIHLKGLNRPYFERLLKSAIKNCIRRFKGSTVEKGEGRYYVRGVDESEIPTALTALSKVFGVHSVSPAFETDKEMDEIFKKASTSVKDFLDKYTLSSCTFKVETKRADKKFPLSSLEVSSELGGRLLETYEELSVDVHNPKMKVFVELREKAFVYVDIIAGQGGMPIGSNGKAVLLLSGGIDSPVAGYMVAKRGVTLEAVHFHSFPYTSDRAKQKVIDLARILSEYTGKIRLHIVHFTEIQTAIHEQCQTDYMTLIMRRYMMKITEKIAENVKGQALVTGESLGQVASQTIESLHVTNSAVNMPVFRPLVGIDKNEIMDRANKLGTYETSILPYEDCCTVFVPKHPATRPKLEKVEIAERVLDEETLINEALEKTEVMDIYFD